MRGLGKSERTSQGKNETLSFSKQRTIRFFLPSLMPSGSHLFILRAPPTLDVKLTQEISTIFERGSCFAGISIIIVLFLELLHALACAGPSFTNRCSERTS